MLLNDYIKNVNFENLLVENEKLPDITVFDLTNKLYLCLAICRTFSHHLDNDPKVKNYYDSFLNLMSNFEFSIAIYAIRTQLSLERVVHHNLDDDKILGPYLHSMTKFCLGE